MVLHFYKLNIKLHQVAVLLKPYLHAVYQESVEGYINMLIC